MYNKYSVLYDEWARCYDPLGIELTTISNYVEFQGKRVLEIGCGTGRFTSTIANIVDEIIAIDNDPDSISVAIKRGFPDNVHFKCCDAHDIHLIKDIGRFDIIVFSWSINYIDEIEILFSKLETLLNDYGHVVVLFTSLGEYESMMTSITGEDSINSVKYDYIKTSMKTFFINVTEDIIITPFVFSGIEEAIRLNIFFLENDGIAIDDIMLNKLYSQMLSHQNEGGTITISDTVKLLVGEKKCLN